MSIHWTRWTRLLDYRLAGASLRSWLIGAAVALAVSAGLSIVRALLRRRVQRWSTHRTSAVPDLLASVLLSTRRFFFFGVGLWAGSEYVALSPSAARWFRAGVSLVVLAQVGIWLQVAIERVSDLWGMGARDSSARTMATAIAFIAKLGVWVLLFVMALSSLGFEISALVAGLGVGGVAAALAVQNILGDLLASLSMFFDRPFDLGDFVTIGTEGGTVERIGLRSTRLRALAGEEIVFANGDLIKSRIHNYKRMQQRRVVLTIGVDYSTSIADLERVPEIIRGVFEGRQQLRFERAHLYQYGALSLEFEVVYFVLSQDFSVHMDERQAIHLELLKRFREQHIEIAHQPSAVPPPH